MNLKEKKIEIVNTKFNRMIREIKNMASKAFLRDFYLFWSGIIVSFLLQLFYDAIREDPFYQRMMPMAYWRGVLAVSCGIAWFLVYYFIKRTGALKGT